MEPEKVIFNPIFAQELIRSVTSSNCHTLVLSSLGCVYSCGDGSDGQLGLGHGSYESSKFLRPIDWFNKSGERIIIEQISCASDEITSHSAAIDSNRNCYVVWYGETQMFVVMFMKSKVSR